MFCSEIVPISSKNETLSQASWCLALGYIFSNTPEKHLLQCLCSNWSSQLPSEMPKWLVLPLVQG